MLTDPTHYFSEDQAITETALGDHSIDAGAVADLGIGDPLYPCVRITETFTVLTSLDIELVGADDEALTENVVAICGNLAVGASDLVEGAKIVLPVWPAGTSKRYFGLKFTVNGDPAEAGKVTAWLAAHGERNH